MTRFNALDFTSRLRSRGPLVTDFVQIGAVFGVILNIFLAGGQVRAASAVLAATTQLDLARRDSSQYLTHSLQKSTRGQMTYLEPVGVCRDPLASQANSQVNSPATPQKSVLIMANSKDIPSMRKDQTLVEQALRRSPVTRASLILRESQHQREVVTGQLNGLYLIRGFSDELRVTGTIDEMGSDGATVTKSINMELSSVESSFASFNGNQVFECRLTHPQLIRFEK